MITLNSLWVQAWVAEMIGKKGPWENCVGMGVLRNRELVGGVVVDDYIPDTRCSVHCAGVGKKWLNRDFINLVFDYVFNQLKCKVIINQVASTNADSIRFTKHLGFKEVCRIPEGVPGADMVIFAMHRADCRWFNLRGTRHGL